MTMPQFTAQLRKAWRQYPEISCPNLHICSRGDTNALKDHAHHKLNFTTAGGRVEVGYQLIMTPHISRILVKSEYIEVDTYNENTDLPYVLNVTVFHYKVMCWMAVAHV